MYLHLNDGTRVQVRRAGRREITPRDREELQAFQAELQEAACQAATRQQDEHTRTVREYREFEEQKARLKAASNG